MRDESIFFKEGDVMLENRECHVWTASIIDGVKLVDKDSSPSYTTRRQWVLSTLYLDHSLQSVVVLSPCYWSHLLQYYDERWE